MSLLIKPRVVLDSNIFVSGIVWAGNPARVLDLWMKGEFHLLISPKVLIEIIEVLTRFQISFQIVSQLQILIETHAIKIIPKTSITSSRDMKDNKYLNLSVDGHANYLVSGDKDLLELGSVGPTSIITAKNFLELMEDRERLTSSSFKRKIAKARIEKTSFFGK